MVTSQNRASLSLHFFIITATTATITQTAPNSTILSPQKAKTTYGLDTLYLTLHGWRQTTAKAATPRQTDPTKHTGRDTTATTAAATDFVLLSCLSSTHLIGYNWREFSKGSSPMNLPKRKRQLTAPISSHAAAFLFTS